MTQRTESKPSLPTIWRVPGESWAMFERLRTELDPPKRRGQPRIDARAAMDGILYRARTGCQWNQLPAVLGNDSSVHRTFQRWAQKGHLARNAGKPDVQQRIIRGRVHHLENEIANFERRIEGLRSGRFVP